jgi:hypothetical protein
MHASRNRNDQRVATRFVACMHATPYTGEPCSAHDLDGDGYLDLTLKFKTREVVQTLGLAAFSDRDVVILILTGNFKAEHGGAPIQGQDCVVLLKRGK